MPVHVVLVLEAGSLATSHPMGGPLAYDVYMAALLGAWVDSADCLTLEIITETTFADAVFQGART